MKTETSKSFFGDWVSIECETFGDCTVTTHHGEWPHGPNTEHYSDIESVLSEAEDMVKYLRERLKVSENVRRANA